MTWPVPFVSTSDCTGKTASSDTNAEASASRPSNTSGITADYDPITPTPGRVIDMTRHLPPSAWCHTFLGLVVAAVVSTAPAYGQGGAVTLRGFIFDSATAEALGDASLELDGVQLSTKTDVEGSFAISNVPTGTHTLIVHKIGFVPRAFEFLIQPSDPQTIDMGVLALAKIQTRDVTVFGNVSDASTKGPIEGVQIAINDTLIAVTDPVGDFSVQRRIADGVNRLTVQRIGYKTLVQEFRIEPLATEITLMIDLPPEAERLTDIVVESHPPALNRKLEGFYKRLRQDIGQFLTPEEVAQIPASMATDILRRVAGLRVFPGDVKSEFALARCLRYQPRVYVDGHELTSADIDLTLNPRDISAVEVYTGDVAMPPEFNRPAPGRCGVVVIWTK